ncbi:helicase HerA-like domain-containing protein [Streptomyces triculaminicus]|uniref:helicase HerA-like domain-containing protein n=1 Tax=Streptomyces triculaminicus TaxID=2816232 RepID=UPI0033DBCDC8
MLGSVLDEADQPISALGITTDTLNRHAFVAGATGSGKSQTVRHLLESLHDTEVPWLVIEPAKAEYANLAGRLADRGEVTVIRPGAPDDTPVGLNPLEPEPGFPLQTHLDLVRALFLAAFEATDPFPQVLSQALTRCYQETGWNLTLGTRRGVPRAPRYPGLADVQKAALEVVDNIGYGKEVADNVRGFIDVRLGSLRMGTPGWFFEAHHPIDMSSLLDRNVVLEIEDIGNDQDKAFFIGAVLIRIYEHLRVHRTDTTGGGGLRHVTVIEEAHRLLKNVPPGSPAAHCRTRWSRPFYEDVTSLLEEADGADDAELSIRTKSADGLVDKVNRMTEGSEGRKARPDYEIGEAVDAVGARITVEDTAQLETVLEKAKEHFGTREDGRLLEVENMYAEPKSGNPSYRVIPMVVAIEVDGKPYTYELQLTTERASVAADLEHNTVCKAHIETTSEERDVMRKMQAEAAAVDQEETRRRYP